jgi:hypothetical protein
MFSRTGSTSEAMGLERRVDLALKGMNMLLLGEAESVSRNEKKELQSRLKDCLTGKGSEFVELKDLQGPDSQEGN